MYAIGWQKLFFYGISLFSLSHGEKLGNKEAYANLKISIKSVRESCGKVCDTEISGKSGKYFDVLKKDIQCDPLFTNPDIDVTSEFKSPLQRVPKWLRDDYSYLGKVEIVNEYLDDSTGGNKTLHTFSSHIIDLINDQMDKKIFRGRLHLIIAFTCLLIKKLLKKYPHRKFRAL